MSKKTKYILVLIFIVGVILLYRLWTYSFGFSAGNFKKVYEVGDAATKENYSAQCKSEFENNLVFPLGAVDKAVVCTGFFSFDKTLGKDQTNQLLILLNDTASYAWGEVGTFNPDRVIVFYDKQNKPLGITQLEENVRQSYSYPYLKRTKWGALTDEAMGKVSELTNE